jgi:hypothetical protein
VVLRISGTRKTPESSSTPQALRAHSSADLRAPARVIPLSCLLENCMIPSIASKLPNPLTGIVFHYDTFISDDGGSPCEAAFLASNPKIQVRVLCSPTNFHTIKVSVLLGYECRRLTISIRGHIISWRT